MKRGTDSGDNGTATKGGTMTMATDDCERGVQRTARTRSTDTVEFATAAAQARNSGVAPPGCMKEVIKKIDQSGSDFDRCKFRRIYRVLSTPWPREGTLPFVPL